MAEPSIEIRLLEAGDSLVVLTELLHRAYAPLGKMGLNYTAVDQSVEDTEKQLRLGVCFLALAGDQMVGTITVRTSHPWPGGAWFQHPGVCSIARFAVAPELQKQGLGSQLLSRAEAWARESGYRELAADTAEQATHLVEFYTRRGFRRVETIQWPGKTYASAVLSKTLAPTA